MTACGYTPAQIDDLAMADTLALIRYWRQSPPVHEILAAVYGVAPRESRHDIADPSGIAALLARHPSGQVKSG